MKIYPFEAGNTLDSHKKFLSKLTKRGAKAVETPGEGVVTIVFCPIVSRVESDINAAVSMASESGCNNVIMVAMHNTFDKDHTLPSNDEPNHPAVTLLVHCLFYERNGLLKCSSNEKAVKLVCKKLGLEHPFFQMKFPDVRTMFRKIKIYPFEAGNTLDSHNEFLSKLTKRGAKAVETPGEGVVTIVFCPIVSRLESDINAAVSMASESGCNNVIMVAMHNTFDKDHTLPSNDEPNHPAVTLLVHCLFYERNGLLKCSSNEKAVKMVCTKLGLKFPQDTPLSPPGGAEGLG